MTIKLRDVKGWPEKKITHTATHILSNADDLIIMNEANEELGSLTLDMDVKKLAEIIEISSDNWRQIETLDGVNYKPKIIAHAIASKIGEIVRLK